jgi:F-type H+-transporting ATPase subunit c
MKGMGTEKQPNINLENFDSLTVARLRGLLDKQNSKGNNMLMPMLAEMTGNLHVAAAAAGAAIGVGMIGMKASEAVGRNPGAATKILVQAILSTAFAEGIVFFAIFLAK